MFIAVRQRATAILTLRTTATRKVTDRDLDRATRAANADPRVESGYYDVVLTADPSDPRYDRDSVTTIK